MHRIFWPIRNLLFFGGLIWAVLFDWWHFGISRKKHRL